MNNNFIINKLKKFVNHQRLIDFFAYLIFSIATIAISISVALLLLKSPLYGFIGIIPLLFYRPITLTQAAKFIEQKIGLKGELVNSIQLSSIAKDNKEKYSQELINAYIDDVVEKIKAIDFRRYINHNSLNSAVRVLLIAIAICLIHPVIMPTRFWYSLNHEIDYSIEPGSGQYLKGSDIELVLNLWGAYLPKKASIVITKNDEVIREKIVVENGIAKKNIEMLEPLTYHFEFLGHKTDEFTLAAIEPLYIENLSFRLEYPRYTKLKQDTKTGRQLIAPKGTKVYLSGRASAALEDAWFEFGDTTNLMYDGKEFSGEFGIRESGTALLHLKAYNELKEKIRIYSVPDLAPLLDIFYPGYNINLPYDMKVGIGIKCSDDYGLKKGIFYYKFKDKQKKVLALKKGAVEDTIFFTWDLSDFGMLPGDEISYFVEIADNGGNVTTSKSYHIYFPTVEEIYRQVSEEENLIHAELRDLQSEHTKSSEELARIQQRLMKERELSWAEIEKLREVIKKEENILDKIEEWQVELERTIEKLNEGIVLDQKSIERLQEIAKILQEIASEELKQALENLQLQLDKKPEDIKHALENLKNAQEKLAKALERTLEILKRYQQEEKLKELAERAKELAQKINEIKEFIEQSKKTEADKETKKMDEAIDKLADDLEELAESEGLGEEIKEVLENLAKQAGDMSGEPPISLEDKQKGLNLMAAELERLYETLTKGRAAYLRKKLLEILNQLIELSKTEEQLYRGDFGADAELQDQVITVTKTVAESLYTQQNKSWYVTPQMGKNIAKAIKQMEKTRQQYEQEQMSPQSAQEAMKLLNMVSHEMLQKLKEIAEGAGSSTGMDKFLRGLSDISKGQMSLNQSMMNLFPLPMTGLTSEQMGQIQKLAGRQGKLREALESLRGEAGIGKHQELLENIVNEMKKAEEDLYQYKLDRELIERQQLIISRLLDAQRSIRKEDYGKRRTSKPGQDILSREQPTPLPQELGIDQLRELIQKALRESYPKEYELYIREYFKALLEER